jgi:hypothetical protein
MRTLSYLFAAFLLTCTLTSNALAPQLEAKRVAVMLIVEGDDDDERTVTTIFTTLMAAERVAKMLDAELIADEKVEDDVYVFSLKSNEQQELAMKIFDEEGYEYAGNIFEAVDGTNYRTVNVETLKDGTYTLKLQNGDKELTQKMVVSRGKITK